MNENLTPKVSIIIPVFNVEKYLKECINSVLNQTLKEIEIILVDDGSTDGSGMICDEYAMHDMRIRVIHERNKGLSCARNNGIALSTAPYIMFIDSDDWVDPQFCELPYSIAVKYNSDMVLFTHNIVGQDGKIKSKVGMWEGPISEAEAMYYNIIIANAAWLALYKRNLFEEYSFPEGKYYEDVGVVHRLIHLSNRIYFSNTALYYHRLGRKGSITAEFDAKKHRDYLEMYAIRVEDLINWKYDNYARQLAFSILLKYGSQEDYFANVVRQTKAKTLKGWKQRIMLFVFKFSTKLFDTVCKITGKRIL